MLGTNMGITQKRCRFSQGVSYSMSASNSALRRPSSAMSSSVVSNRSANLSLAEVATREQALASRQRQLEARAAATQAVNARRAELAALKLSELVKLLQEQQNGDRSMVNRLLDSADPKKAIVEALVSATQQGQQ
jgi:hypothetical protein